MPKGQNLGLSFLQSGTGKTTLIANLDAFTENILRKSADSFKNLKSPNRLSLQAKHKFLNSDRITERQIGRTLEKNNILVLRNYITTSSTAGIVWKNDPWKNFRSALV
jgi:hypothetical protein